MRSVIYIYILLRVCYVKNVTGTCGNISCFARFLWIQGNCVMLSDAGEAVPKMSKWPAIDLPPMPAPMQKNAVCIWLSEQTKLE